MKVLRKIGEEIKEVNYPHIDISKPVAGLQEGILYYFIEEKEKPVYNSEKSYLKPFENLTERIHDEFNHLLICERGFEVVDFPKEQIIEKLNLAVGDWIESRLPVWKQVKYISRFMYLDILKAEGTATEEQLREMSYLNDLDNWVIKCRNDRDLREKDLIENDVFPLFYFDEMPQKNF